MVALNFLGDHSGVEIDVFLTRLLGGVLTLAGVLLTLRLLFRGWISQRMDSWGGLTPSGRGLLVLVGLGAVIGALVGLTSVGSGTLFIVMLTTLMRMTMRNVVGTDVAHSAILTAGAGLLHLGFGNVDLALAGKYPYRFYTGGHHWESSHRADSGERTPNGGCPGADRSGA